MVSSGPCHVSISSSLDPGVLPSLFFSVTDNVTFYLLKYSVPFFISRLFRILCLHMIVCCASCNSKCLGCVLVQRESKSSDFKGVSGVYVLCYNYWNVCNFNEVNPIFVWFFTWYCMTWKLRWIIWFWIFKLLKKIFFPQFWFFRIFWGIWSWILYFWVYTCSEILMNFDSRTSNWIILNMSCVRTLS